MEKRLDKGAIGDWIAALDGWKVQAPVFRDDLWTYAPTDGTDRPIALDHPNTAQPPKGFSFPQREVFFTFEQAKGAAPRLTPLVPAGERQVVFGARPCDARGLTHMDRVFATDYQDGYYQTRRQGLAYVGLACNRPPSRNCFCLSTGGSPFSEDGLDVLLIDLGDRYLARAITALGESLMQAGAELFAEPTPADRDDAQRLRTAALAYPQRGIEEPGAVPERLKASFDSPLWESLAQPCIACGICTFLCPTCHCFDLNDEVTTASPLAGSRVRTWDSCQFPDFTMHASGHNPRGHVGTRLRQRVCHKLQYFSEIHGVFQCTGCGRCITACPVGIDIVTVANRIAAEAARMPPADDSPAGG